MALYRMILQLIEQGRTDGLLPKITLFRDTGRITAEEFEELQNLLIERSVN